MTQASPGTPEISVILSTYRRAETLRRTLDHLIAQDLPEDLRFTRSGQHFIVFIEDATQVIIVDFLHSRADLPGKLAALPDPKSGRGN